MWALYLYAAVAAGGILSLPSYGAWWSAKNNVDWWKCEPNGKHCSSSYNTAPLFPMPVTYFMAFLGWPLFITGMLIYKGTNLLALPGKAFVALAAQKKQNDRFLTEAKKEVEKLLSH